MTFLLSYWWLIVLALIIVGFITNTVKKVISFLFFVIVLGILIVIVSKAIIGEEVQRITACYQEATEETDRDIVLIKSENWTLEEYCVDDEVDLTTLANCIENIESSISIEMVEKVGNIFTGRKESYSDYIVDHNIKCADYPATIIKD